MKTAEELRKEVEKEKSQPNVMSNIEHIIKEAIAKGRDCAVYSLCGLSKPYVDVIISILAGAGYIVQRNDYETIIELNISWE